MPSAGGRITFPRSPRHPRSHHLSGAWARLSLFDRLPPCFADRTPASDINSEAPSRHVVYVSLVADGRTRPMDGNRDSLSIDTAHPSRVRDCSHSATSTAGCKVSRPPAVRDPAVSLQRTWETPPNPGTGNLPDSSSISALTPARDTC